jgi:hypothetical protein
MLDNEKTGLPGGMAYTYVTDGYAWIWKII